MEFLLDVNLPPSLAKLLESSGFKCRLSKHLIPENSPDIDILNIAELSGEVILTHDLDFGTLLAITGKHKPSVIIFRLHNINSQVLYQLLINNLDNIQNQLIKGAIITITTDSIRIRQLPIRK